MSKGVSKNLFDRYCVALCEHSAIWFRVFHLVTDRVNVYVSIGIQ